MMRASDGYWIPYLAGLALGGVLTTSFVLTGRGLGVSGALSDLVRSVLPLQESIPLAGDPMISEVIGLVIGAAISGALAGRAGAVVSGGFFVGVGSRFAHGCTSGQALSGGALLSVGSWVFMITLFVAAYAMTGVMRRSWT